MAAMRVRRAAAPAAASTACAMPASWPAVGGGYRVIRSGTPSGGVPKVSATDGSYPGPAQLRVQPGRPEGSRARHGNRAGPRPRGIHPRGAAQQRAAAQRDAASGRGQGGRRGGQVEADVEGADGQLHSAAGASRSEQAAQRIRGRQPCGARAERAAQRVRWIDEQLLRRVGGQGKPGQRGLRVGQAQRREQAGQGGDRATRGHRGQGRGEAADQHARLGAELLTAGAKHPGVPGHAERAALHQRDGRASPAGAGRQAGRTFILARRSAGVRSTPGAGAEPCGPPASQPFAR